MKKNLLLLTAACAFMAAACSVDNSENNEPTPTPQPEKTVVKFYPTLTRATETAFENGDMISVFAVEPSAGSSLKSRGNYADNVCYTYSETAFTAENGISLPADSDGLAYYAVYPYSSIISDKGYFTVKTNQQTHANITASDFCTAYASTTNSKEVQLNFSHRLSRICIEIKGENLASKTVTMKLSNVRYEMSYDLNANTFAATDKKSEIQMGETSTNYFEAIVVPQTISSGVTTIVVTIDDKDYPLSFGEETIFRSGKEYYYPLIYAPEDKIVILQGDINPWDTEDKRLNDVVPEDIQEKMSEHMPIYSGVNPPNVEGTYFIDPFEAVYFEDNPSVSGKFYSYYCRFMNQNNIDNTIDYQDVSEIGSDSNTGTGAFISGSGSNFTAFFNTTGETNGIFNRTALVISGTKTSDGIKDLYYAFVLVEKGDDPEHILMEEGIFRVFHDQDGLSVNSTWPSFTRSIAKDNGWQTPWTKVSRAE